MNAASVKSFWREDVWTKLLSNDVEKLLYWDCDYFDDREKCNNLAESNLSNAPCSFHQFLTILAAPRPTAKVFLSFLFCLVFLFFLVFSFFFIFLTISSKQSIKVIQSSICPNLKFQKNHQRFYSLEHPSYIL